MKSRPQVIGRYRVNRVLGHGAMGTVYLAQDPLLMRPVAIKVLRDPEGDQSQIMARFQREAVVSAKLNHPHVITIFDVGEDPNYGPFMAMEYVDGATLADLVREGLAPEPGLRLLAQTMSALVASEAEGIAHRDVKPDNILVGKDWRVKLMDFGIARSDGARLTQAGQIFGTPYYTAPEVLVGGEASFISDRYSFAVTAFEVLSGALPFHGNSVGTVVYRIVHEPPEYPDTMGPALRAIFEQALNKHPKARFPDLFTFMDVLIEAVDLPEEARPRLRHYISEVRVHATEPPMMITQSLDEGRDSNTRTTAITGPFVAPEKTMEIPVEEEDPYDGPAYQTVVIPPMKLPTLPIPTPEPPPALALEELNPLDVTEETWMDASLVLLPETFEQAPPPAMPPPPQAGTRPLEILPEPPPTKVSETAITPEKAVTAPVASVAPAPDPSATAPLALPAPVPVAPAPATPSIQLASPEPAEPGKTKPFPVLAPIAKPDLPEPPGPRGKHLGLVLWVAVILVAGALVTGAFLLTRHPRPAAAQALFVITSTPDGATVYFDGKRIGSTPMDQMQSQDIVHTLRLEKTGFQTETRKIQPGETSAHFTLQVQGFSIAVTSDPPGADVFLNDQPVGITPIPSLIVPFAGRREILIRRPGFVDWRAEVDPDLPFPDHITLNPVPTRGRKR